MVVKLKKLKISENWTEEERQMVCKAISSEIKELEDEYRNMSQRIHYEAPCLIENKRARGRLKHLILVLDTQDSLFLEDNRRNFGAFITKRKEKHDKGK